MAASASTTISNANNTTTTNTQTTQAGSNGVPSGHKMPASEVGWCFVHEYYTFLNKDPSRLHCFYGQKSTLIHGTEGETVTPSQGEKEIKEKFQGLNLENCRVLVTNVDSQASINGGILIQVLGEISNRNEVARRFAQTFFLDVQPNVTNGYYVLNDIIRFLSDDDIEIYNGEEEAGASASPTGTLVEEPINARVDPAGQSNSPLNTTITESAQVTSRSMDGNISVPSSKENEALLQTVPVNGEVIDPFVDNNTRSPASASIMLNTNLQTSNSMVNVQSVQNEPSLPIMLNHNGQTGNKQESATTLVVSMSQEEHVNGQVLSVQSIQTYPNGPQSTPGFSTNIQQPPVIVIKKEPVTVSANIESQTSLGNDGQSTITNVISSSSISTSSSVEQDNGRQSAIISKQVIEQSPISQEVGQVPSTQNNVVSLTIGVQSPPVTQDKTWHPATIPKQIPTQSPAVSVTPQSQANVQVVPSIPKSLNNDMQSQADNHSPRSSTDNIQISLNGQKSSSEDDNNRQTPMTGFQSNSKGNKPVSRPESPGVNVLSHHSQPPVVNSKGHSKQQVNKVNTTTQADKKKNVQNVPKDDVATGANDPEIHDEKLSDKHIPQAQLSTKKTWASLAANESERWSSNALAEAKGVVASVSAKSVPHAQSQQMRDIRDRRSEGQKNNNRRNSDTSLSIYVKGVTSSMSYEQLKAAFAAFGHVKHLDVVHTKSCAFVEYNNAESYRRALEAHTVDVGGETVNTEERRVRRNNGKAPRGRF
ncbi:hypothetical protein C1645_872874 [Glomus cerebriforme]|uniref:NTF2 domain-containing protein n=1 Tax=Glomus cerebriforme TaxID=658196 RepID=A0A397TAK2_9GLOM|nr:hypothetical protein C1645_872874 [Glomus cerebriforme]